MCTAITYRTKDHYFGRTLDLEYSYQESVTITPRNYPIQLRRERSLRSHYAMIGMAYVVEDYPLYYDATNEKGLSIAGLNFPGNAVYYEEVSGMDNVTPFELPLWLLGQCSSVAQVRALLKRMNLTRESFCAALPLTPLHWMIADRESAIVVEATAGGMELHENPVGVMTNNPPFAMQLFYLNQYMGLTREVTQNRFSDQLELKPYSLGMGALGLPGDMSSPSRFVRAAFTRLNSVSGDSEQESISQFFHILGSVEQIRGCVKTGTGQYEITVYTSCCNTDKGIYYYTTYGNRQINGVDLHKEDLDGCKLVSYPLFQNQEIRMHN